MTTTITDADVKVLINTARDTTPFIDAADCLVSEIVGSGTAAVPDSDQNPQGDNPICQSPPTTLTQRRIDCITKYLAAHFVYVTEANGVVASQIGTSRDEYFTRYADKSVGFATSKFGAIALSMDTTGRLAAASSNNGIKARFGVFQQSQTLPPDFWLFGWF